MEDKLNRLLDEEKTVSIFQRMWNDRAIVLIGLRLNYFKEFCYILFIRIFRRQCGRVVYGAGFRHQSERAWVRNPPLSNTIF